jgi:hypothetical protein
MTASPLAQGEPTLLMGRWRSSPGKRGLALTHFHEWRRDEDHDRYLSPGPSDRDERHSPVSPIAPAIGIGAHQAVDATSNVRLTPDGVAPDQHEMLLP